MDKLAKAVELAVEKYEAGCRAADSDSRASFHLKKSAKNALVRDILDLIGESK